MEMLAQAGRGVVAIFALVATVLICIGIGTLLLPRVKNDSPSAYFVRFIAGAFTVIVFGVLGYILGGLF